MKKILITGAGGFIGGFLVEKAINKGYETWAGVRNSTSREYLTDEAIQFIDLSFHNTGLLIKELTDLKHRIGKWDLIIHNLGVTKCTDQADFDKINFEVVKNFSEALIVADMIPEQFILMSSLGSFGPGDEENMSPINLKQKQNPNTLYGTSKLKAENHLRSLAAFPFVIVRPTGVYGPREKDYFLMIKTIKSGFDFVPGFRPQRITFIYVKDLVNCIFQIIDKGVVRKEYLVAEGVDYSSSDFRRFVQQELNQKWVIPITIPLWLLKGVSLIAERIAQLAGKPSTLNSDKYKIMKQRNWICDISPLKEELDFTPSYSLQKGIHETVRWYKENGWI